MGWVDNRDGPAARGAVRHGDGSSCPRPKDEVAIPATAVVEEGDGQFVFVQPDASDERVRAAAGGRVAADGQTVFVCDRPTPATSARGAQAACGPASGWSSPARCN